MQRFFYFVNFPENVISMFGDETLGETIYGLTAEEVKLIGDGKMEYAAILDNKILLELIHLKTS